MTALIEAPVILPETTTPEVTVTPEVTTPIKPSQAIKLGRLIRPHKRRRMFFYGDKAACTMGAMIIGVGGMSCYSQTYVNWNAALPPEIRRYVGEIPRYFDSKEKTEEQIIQELEDLGY